MTCQCRSMYTSPGQLHCDNPAYVQVKRLLFHLGPIKIYKRLSLCGDCTFSGDEYISRLLDGKWIKYE